MNAVTQPPIKIEYPPLLPPGFHDIEEGKLEELFVEPFPDSTVRKKLVEGLKALLSVVRQMSISFEIWLDGSFTTEKKDPADIDVVIFVNPIEAKNLSPPHQRMLSELSDNNKTRMKYSCDLYFAITGMAERRSYWRGWFCFTRDEKPKGIARIFI